MTSTLNLPEQLATPGGSRIAQPSAFLVWEDNPASTSLGAGTSDRSFLARAEADASVHPASALALARLAQAAEAAGEYERGSEAAITALELGLEQSVGPAVYAALMVLRSARTAPAIARGVWTDPRCEQLPLNVRVRTAIQAEAFDGAIKLLQGSDSGADLAVEAWLHLQMREYSNAIAAARAAQRHGAGGPALFVNLGYAHAALGNLGKAISTTRRAVALAPDSHIAAFNLADFYRADGQPDAALEVLQALAKRDPFDFDLGLGIAGLRTEAGDLEEARRGLQRLRTSSGWVHAPLIRRSELDANLALLRWMTSRERYAQTRQAVLLALSSCMYQSLPIADMLLRLLGKETDSQQMNAVVNHLAERHPERRLHPYRMHLALLERNGAAAVHHAVAWAEQEDLNSLAAAVAAHLVGDIDGEYGRAAELGTTALRRNPNDLLLVNNTAYVLALAGRPYEARSILARYPAAVATSVTLSATQGLTDYLTGDDAAGRAGYQRARHLARDTADPGFEALVATNEALAERLWAKATGQTPTHTVPTIPDATRNESRFWIVSHRVARELSTDPEPSAN
jgi:tetratricopeptide (TPR) repeat protein